MIEQQRVYSNTPSHNSHHVPPGIDSLNPSAFNLSIYLHLTAKPFIFMHDGGPFSFDMSKQAPT